jgi:hypothetical protein
LKEEAEGNHEFRLFLEVRGALLSASQGICLCSVCNVERKPQSRRAEDGAQGIPEPSIGAPSAV